MNPTPHIALESVTVDLPLPRRTLYKAHRRYGRRGGRIHRNRRGRPFVRALDAISLELRLSDRVGVYGANGAGKTTLLRVLAGGYEPTSGRISRYGRIASLLDMSLRIDGSANGYENIELGGLYLGLSLADIRARIPEIAAFAELGDYLALPVRTYSTGMKLRLAFAIKTCFNPEILLMDEWLSFGDPNFVAKAERRLEEFVDRAGIVVLASQDPHLLRRVCRAGVLLQRGRVAARGPIEEVLADQALATDDPARPHAPTTGP